MRSQLDGPRENLMLLVAAATVLFVAFFVGLCAVEHAHGQCLLPPDWTAHSTAGECEANPALDCACNEIVWDAPLYHGNDPVERYEVQRATVSSGEYATVGIVSQGDDGEGGLVPPGTAWHSFRDSSITHETVRYKYRVRACNASGCSAWSAEEPITRGWPTLACFEDGQERQCYVGAACKIPPPTGCAQ